MIRPTYMKHLFYTAYNRNYICSMFSWEPVYRSLSNMSLKAAL